jgi:hypothetical protein
MSSTSILIDQPTPVQPGQYSEQDLVAAVYLDSYHRCHEQIDKLPGMYATGEISLQTYADTDAHLCAMAEVFADCLAKLGQPLPASYSYR